MMLKVIISMLWIFFCTFLLLVIVAGFVEWKIPITILSSFFLFIAYGGFFIIFRRSAIDQSKYFYGFMVTMSTFSSICTIMILLIFYFFTCVIFGILPNGAIKFLRHWSGFYGDVMLLISIFSGGLIAFILWHWIIVRDLKGSPFYILGRMQIIFVIIYGYIISLGMDYINFIQHN